MAVSKMQLVTIVGPVSKFDETAAKILRLGCFQPENIRNMIFGFKKLLPFKEESKYKVMLKQLTDFCANNNIKMKFSEDELECNLDDVMGQIDKINASFDNIEKKIKEIETTINENEQVLHQLLPLLNVNMNLDDLYKLEFIKFRFGRMTKASYEHMLKNIHDDKLFIFIPASIEKEYVWGIYFAPEKYIEYVDGIFVALRFERIRISDEAKGIPKNAYDNITKDIEENKKYLVTLKQEHEKLIEDFKKHINPAYSKLQLLNYIEELKKVSSHSENNFYTTGWVALKDTEKFKDVIDNIGEVNYTVKDPSFSKTYVPTKLQNISLFRPFEQFVLMYGTPQYNEIDPTPLVAITYAVIFGIMFGDIGQGFVIALGGFLLAALKKIQFGKILVTCGLSSMVFGVIYDSVFGYEGIINRNIFGHSEIVVGFSPAENVNEILLLAVALGVGLIAVAIIMNILNGIKQRDIEKVLFSHNGLAGLIFYGAAVYALTATLFLNKTGVLSAPYVIFLFVVPFLLIFFRSILSDLLMGKKPILSSGIGEYILQNIFELFEIVLSFLTNTISFVRIGAFALNHAGMMLVVFLLAKTTATAAFGSGNPLVVILGNIVVIGLEGLIVGIQVLRLEFYEIFGRFYAGDGNAFTPISLEKNK